MQRPKGLKFSHRGGLCRGGLCRGWLCRGGLCRGWLCRGWLCRGRRRRRRRRRRHAKSTITVTDWVVTIETPSCACNWTDTVSPCPSNVRWALSSSVFTVAIFVLVKSDTSVVYEVAECLAMIGTFFGSVYCTSPLMIESRALRVETKACAYL